MGHVLRNDKLLTERSIKYWRGRVEITFRWQYLENSSTQNPVTLLYKQ